MALVRLTARPATPGAPGIPTTPPARVSPRSPGRRRWPGRARDRWLVRLGLALPLVALALIAGRNGLTSPGHGDIEAQVAAMRAGGDSLRGLGAAYPPLPALLGLVLPGGPTALAVAAALVAGVTLHLLWEQLVALDLPRTVSGGLLAALWATPAGAFFASEALGGILSLSFISLALLGFIRFTADESTEGGFTAGLAFALGFLTSPIALFYALASAAATPFVAPGRFRATPGAASATVGVVLFPTVFVALAWAFLEWRFAGTAYGALRADPQVLAFPGGAAASLAAAAVTVAAAAVHVPLYLVGGVLQARRHPLALVGYLLPVVGSVVAVWVGLLFTAVTVYVFFTVLALAATPRDTGRGERALLLVVAVAQVALAWWWPPASAGFGDWVAALMSAVR